MSSFTDIRRPLEDIEFLARSPSRYRVLVAIDGDPKTRRDLNDETDASRTTVSRMLADFEDRGWITRNNGTYRSTAEGAVVVNEVTRLLENLETASTLDGCLTWLPIHEFDFDLRCLRDADIVTVRWNDPASMRIVADRLNDASHVRSLADSVSREVVEALHELTIEQEGAYEGILSSNAISIIRDHPVLRCQLQEMLASGRVSLYQYDGEEVRSMLLLFDDVLALCNHAKGGPELEGILTDNATVYSWGESYFAAVRSDAQRLGIDDFTE